MKKEFASALIFILLITACGTDRPMVRLEEGISLSNYEVFIVEPVKNETGKEFDCDVAGYLTQHLESELKHRGYEVGNDPNSNSKVLLVRSALLAYEPGSAFKRWLVWPVPAGKTQATVRISLIDKQTAETFGDLVFAEAVTGGGLFSAGADKRILEEIAGGMAREIDKRIKPR
jgi:hypothetical protein